MFYFICNHCLSPNKNVTEVVWLVLNWLLWCIILSYYYYYYCYYYYHYYISFALSDKSKFLYGDDMYLKYDTNAKLLFSVCFTVFYPDAPEPPVVTEIHATSCIVTYQPPRDDHGAPVTGYTLEHRTPGPDSKWIRVNDTPVTDLQYTIDNLTPATEYEFHVAAKNKEGMSNFSHISPKIVTIETPDKPGLPEVIDVTGTSVSLQWTAPDSDGGTDITEYIVMYWTSEDTEYITLPADTDMKTLISYTIRNKLQANMENRFAVAAVNRLGQGPWSERTEGITTYAGKLNTK